WTACHLERWSEKAARDRTTTKSFIKAQARGELTAQGTEPAVGLACSLVEQASGKRSKRAAKLQKLLLAKSRGTDFEEWATRLEDGELQRSRSPLTLVAVLEGQAK